MQVHFTIIQIFIQTINGKAIQVQNVATIFLFYFGFIIMKHKIKAHIVMLYLYIKNQMLSQKSLTSIEQYSFSLDEDFQCKIWWFLDYMYVIVSNNNILNKIIMRDYFLLYSDLWMIFYHLANATLKNTIYKLFYEKGNNRIR